MTSRIHSVWFVLCVPVFAFCAVMTFGARALAAPDINVTVMSLNFGSVCVPGNVQSAFEVQNTGSPDLAYVISVTGTGASAFTVDPACDSGCLVTSGSSAVHTVTFTPTDGSLWSATLNVASNDPDEPSVDVTLSGDGVVAGMSLDPSDTVDFGSVYVPMSSSPQMFTIQNTSDVPINVSAPTLGGNDASEFTLTRINPLTYPINNMPVAGTATFSVACSPTSAGAKSASLHVSGNSPACGTEFTYDVALDCTGVSCDVDGDGHTVPACGGDDCNDGAASIHADASEVVADGVDQDCDGVDNCYADDDDDGYGTSAVVAGLTLNCVTDANRASVSGDCNDSDSSISPGATEICDASDVDEDCDGFADDADPSASAASKTTFYADVDSDGYGDAGDAASACDASGGRVVDATDCDDSDGAVNTAAIEICDGVDNDCSGTADDIVAGCPVDGGADDAGPSEEDGGTPRADAGPRDTAKDAGTGAAGGGPTGAPGGSGGTGGAGAAGSRSVEPRDAGADAGGRGSGDEGCGCRAVGRAPRSAAGMPLALAALALAGFARARRRRPN